MSEPSDTPSSEIEFVNRPVNRKAMSALSMRVAGATLDEICEVVGFPSWKEASAAIDRALREELKADPQNRSRMRDMAGRRFERLLRSVASKAHDPTHPEHLAAVGKAREILKDLVALYGLAAPAEIVVHNPGENEIEAWVMEMLSRDRPALEEADVLEGEIVPEEDSEEPRSA
jgi:hypothetical protein